MSSLMEIVAFGSVPQEALRGFWWIALKGAAVLAAAFAATLLLRRCSASLRHLSWAASFAVLAALPAWTFLLPAWEFELGLAGNWDRRPPAQGIAVQHDSTGSPAAVSSDPLLHSFPALAAPGSYPVAGRWLTGLLNRPELLLALWLLVASALMLRWAAGYAVLRRAIARSRPLRDPEWQGLVSRLCARLGLARPAHLRLGPSRQMPLTWGIRRPGVLLPTEALNWDEGKKEIVLLHELAHVRRRDVLIQHLTAWVSAFYWFNPLVWAASRRLRREREGACDDLVLSLGTRPSEYARHLLNLARGMRSPGWAPVLAMARRSQLEGRLLAILDPQRIRAGASPSRLLAVSLLVILIAAPLAALSPAFPHHPEQSASSSVQGSRSVAHSQSTRSSSSQDGSRSGNISESHDSSRLDIRMDGVRISDDYDLSGIDPGGYFEVVQRTSEGRRRLEIEPSSSGGLIQRFFVNGEKSESRSEAQELLEEAMQTLRRIDRGHERLHGELEAIQEAQVHVRDELERSRLEMQQALREAEQAIAHSQRENRIHLQEAQRQIEEAMSQRRALREEEMQRLQGELQRSQQEMQRAMEEIQQLRETEMARVQDEMRRLEQELEEQKERLRDELAQELRQLEEEREDLHQARQELHQSIRQTLLQAFGATDLRNDPQVWPLFEENAGALASEILSQSSSIRIEDRTIRFRSNSSDLADRIRRFVDQTLPGGLSGLDQGLRNQLQDAIDRLSAELADFTAQR